MPAQTKRMVGARIPSEHAEELQLLSAAANRTVSEIIGIAVEDLLRNPTRVFENAPAEAETFAPDPTSSAGAAEHYVRRQALTLGFHLTSVLLAAFASWLTYEGDKHEARTGLPWEPSDEDIEIGYDVIGAVIRNANWILDNWFSGDEYRREQVSEFLAGFAAEDKELAEEYRVLLAKIDSAKTAIDEIVRTRKEQGHE